MRSPHFRSMRITEDVWCYAAEEGVTGRGQLEKVNSKNARRVADDGARASSRQRAERKVARGKRHSTNQGTTEFVLKTQDCILGMRDLSPESVDIVVTSPPYNLGIKYTNYNDSRNRDEYLVWSLEWANEVRRVLKKDGSFFLNLGAAPSNPLVPHELIVELKKLFKLQNTFHWIKSITVQSKPGDPMSVGHFKPLHSSRFVNDCHEYVFHLTKEGKTQIDRLALGYRIRTNRTLSGGVIRKDAIYDAAVTTGSYRIRPLSAGLARGLILLHSRRSLRSIASSCMELTPQALCWIRF